MRLKFPVFPAFLCAAMLMLSCDKDKSSERQIEMKDLPAQAQTFIGRYFSGLTVAAITTDTEDASGYDVVFTNGNEVEFDRNGNWTDVNCRFTKVPDAIVPEPILAHVSTAHPGMNILEIVKLLSGYEIGISTGQELVYDANGKFIRYDD